MIVLTNHIQYWWESPFCSPPSIFKQCFSFIASSSDSPKKESCHIVKVVPDLAFEGGGGRGGGGGAAATSASAKGTDAREEEEEEENAGTPSDMAAEGCL